MVHENRVKALDWWNKLDSEQKFLAIEKWKSITADKRKNWHNDLIALSSSMVQKIWEETINK